MDLTHCRSFGTHQASHLVAFQGTDLTQVTMRQVSIVILVAVFSGISTVIQGHIRLDTMASDEGYSISAEEHVRRTIQSPVVFVEVNQSVF